MEQIFRLVGPDRAVEIFGVKLVGVHAENGKKLLFSLVFIALILLLGYLLRQLTTRTFINRRWQRRAFWTRQGITLFLGIVLILGLASVWFNDPGRLSTALGLLTAALVFALQRVITALAGYFIILRGKTFNVGDRIRMGGVRGDVIALSLMQTTIMEMGQPPPVQQDDPAMWIQSRQYTGRVVTISNTAIFEEPVYNYTQHFPYIWEEIVVPLHYRSDRAKAEEIMNEAARRHTVSISEISTEDLQEMQRRFFLHPESVRPRVYCRLTDNWLEMTLRFISRDHGIRELKDTISRDILKGFEEAGIEISSATVEVVGLPPLRIKDNG
ncbi:MAG: mechanosensitive ion channel family protein [Desulfovibrionales bacterium]